MSKLGRHRSSGMDLDALLRSSSHAVTIRSVVHTLLCVAALILGFSISREAVLIVVSFRLPNGSLFVKTTSSPHGHEVAIISFPRMQPRRTFSDAKFSMSHRTERAETRLAHRKDPSLPKLLGNANTRAQAERVSFTEFKTTVHHVPTLQLLPQEATVSSTTTSKGRRVSVGRHEILIRAWPHPDPLQTVAAYHLMRIVQEEQQYDHSPKQRKPLLIITPTSTDTFQLARLTSLMHTLRLIPGPLLWIVVEAGNINKDTEAVLSSSTIPFRHLSLQGALPAERAYLMACLRTEGLRYIYKLRLEGIVVFADETATYTLNYFDEVQQVNLFASFPVEATYCADIDGHACNHMPNGISPSIDQETNRSTDQLSLQAPCNPSNRIIYKYPSITNQTTALDWSNFAFNARMLWQNPEISWIKGWDEVFKGKDKSLQNPVDLIKNVTHIESLGKCNYF